MRYIIPLALMLALTGCESLFGPELNMKPTAAQTKAAGDMADDLLALKARAVVVMRTKTLESEERDRLTYFENKADRFVTALRESPNSTERRNNAVQAFRRFEDAIMFYEAQ